MLHFLRRIAGYRKSDLKSVLSARQACEIAEKTVIGTQCAGTMNLSKLENREGKLIWRVSSVSIGSGVTVTIEDASGVVLQNERWGVR